MTAMRVCRCTDGRVCPGCEAAIEAFEQQQGEARDPMSEREWDELERGALWHSYPGMPGW